MAAKKFLASPSVSLRFYVWFHPGDEKWYVSDHQPLPKEQQIWGLMIRLWPDSSQPYTEAEAKHLADWLNDRAAGYPSITLERFALATPKKNQGNSYICKY